MTKQLGFQQIKINAVSVRGLTEEELVPFGHFARRTGHEVRFIEYMPLGETDQADLRVTGEELLQKHPELVPVAPSYIGQPARDYQLPGAIGRVGLIDPVSHRFCADCNRVRVMSDGMLRPCLGSNEEFSLKEALVQEGDTALIAVIAEAIKHKPETHCFDEGFTAEKNMSRIGG